MANKDKLKRDRIIFTLLLLLALLPLEITASIVARETYGEVTSGFLLMGCIGLNIFALALCVAHFWSGIIVMLSFGLLIIWWQIGLVLRMYNVGNEATNIVHWVYSERIKTGDFPKDLSEYVFLRPECKEYIQNYIILVVRHKEFDG